MLHELDARKLGPHGEPMLHAIQTCVHCGFCLAACPTYETMAQEMDSPRGRIFLMKEALENRVPVEQVLPHVDRCLGCLACEPACPSGVPYRDLISPFRARHHAAAEKARPLADRIRRHLTSFLVPFPRRFRWAARLGRLGKILPRFLVPKAFRPMLDLLPDSLPPSQPLPAKIPAKGTRKGSVALLAGCAQQVLAPEINEATIHVLTTNGYDVVIPQEQSCCGALAWHTGDLSAAQWFARNNLAAFPQDVEAVITNAAGCGSGLHEYPMILRGTPLENQAIAFAQKVMDITVFLCQLPSLEPFTTNLAPPRTVAYHDACHLANAQGVKRQPRQLLSSIPGLSLKEIPAGHRCCGSAGSYNLDEPETASELGSKKAADILSTQPDLVLTGNIGCLSQIKLHLGKSGSPLPVRQTIEILAEAWGWKKT